MAVELADAYVSIIPSARGIQANLAKELAPIEGVAATQGEVAGAALGGSFVSKFAGKTGNLLQGLDKQIGAFGGPFSGNLTTIGTSLRAVESGELNAAAGASEFERVGTAAYLGVGLAAAGFGAISVKSALGAEQAEAQLAQAFTKTGHSIDDYGGQLDGARKKLAGFGFDNEQVNASLASLVRVTKDPAKSITLLSLAADTARARNEDLSTSTQRLVNVEAGRIRGLTQLGISTKDANGNTITSEEAIQRITALYGGSAAANAKTYEGELQALGATAHNLEERLGGEVLPVVANLGNKLVAGADAVGTINAATHGWLGTLGEVALIGGGVFVAVSKINSGLSSLSNTFQAQRVATEAGTAADLAAAGATGARAAATAPLIELEQAEVAASLELTAANEALAAAIDSVAFATGAEVVSDAELLAASEAVTAAEEAQAIASANLAAAQGGAAASAGFLGTGVSAAGVAGLAAVAGIGAFVGTTKLLDAVVGATKPNVDELTSSLLNLANAQPGDSSSIDAKSLAGDIRTNEGSTIQKGFGLSGSSHQAIADIKAENDALIQVLQTGGVAKADVAFGRLTNSLEAQGLTASQIGPKFDPFISKLDLAVAKERDAKGTTDSLGGSFSDLAKGLEADSAKLGLADQLDAAKTAVDDLNQLKLDAAGQGDKSKQAAEQEAQAQSSLTDAYRSQSTAATSLADAKSKLAQFDGPTDSRIRSLQQQQIEDRVVTTPEEARQKEIDLLQFSEDSANKRADLQSQVVSAENSVVSATEGVAKAQQSVSDAAKARRDVQTQAAAAIEGAERKAKEAIDAAGDAISKAQIAGQLGKGNTQLNIYVGLLDQLAHRVDPNSPLSKGLDQFLAKAATANFNLPGPFVPGQPSTFGGLTGTQAQSGPFLPGVPSTFVKTPAVSQPAAAPHIDARQYNTFHGNDVPTTSELDTLNKKQAIRLSGAGVS